MDNKVNINWYPGHMTKAMRMMEADIKLIDLIIEIVDARIPVSSRNPDIDRLGKNKARLVLLNKSDLADKNDSESWRKHFVSEGIECLIIDSKKGLGLKDIKNAVMKACKDKIERDRKKGIVNRPLRAMVCGIPNVGKSTFINAYAKKACTKTGNKPGVTKGKQWIRLDNTLELLDTPGVLWPKFDNVETGYHLAMIGSINDEILHEDDIALYILSFLCDNYPGRVNGRYNVAERDDCYDLLCSIGVAKNALIKGGEVDVKKVSKMVIDDFRNGKFGYITIERI